MKTKLFFSISVIAALNCGAQQAEHPIAREVVKPGKEPEVFHIKDEDKEMAKAFQSARSSVQTFITALQHPTHTQRDFEVKKPFVQGGVVEHLWLSNVTFTGNRFHGIVDNSPVNIKGVKMGDRVSVNPDEISDWAYVDKGELVGGYTIRLLASELSPSRRRQLEKECNFKIGKQ